MATTSGTGPGEADSSEEYVDVLFEPETAAEGHNAVGDPGEGSLAMGWEEPITIPVPVPVWDPGPICEHVARAVADTLGLNGHVLAHVPGNYIAPWCGGYSSCNAPE